MAEEKPRRTSAGFKVVLLVLVVLVAGAFLAPVFPCGACDGRGGGMKTIALRQDEYQPCPACNGKGKLTLWGKMAGGK